MNKLTIFALVALGVGGGGVPAAAETASIVVAYEDLDLSNDAGIARLQARIHAAVGRVCGKPEPRQVVLTAEREKCAREAMNSAGEQVGRERALALLGGSSPRG